MPAKIRVYELARELGLTNKETLDLCESLGIGVKSHSSSIVDAQADRARRKAEREGLIRDEQPAEEAPKKAPAKKKAAAKKKAPAKKKAAAKKPAAEEPAAEPEEAEPAAPEPAPEPVVAEVAPEPAEAAAEPVEAAAEPVEAAAEPVEAAAEPVEEAAAPAEPERPRRVVTSSGSSGPTRPPKIVPPAETAPPAPAEAPAARAERPAKPPEEAPEAPAARATSPEAAPTSMSGKPIPPPPGPPTSMTGKPIPPPPGKGGRTAPPPGRRPSGGPRPSTGSSTPRPGGAGAPATPGAPAGGRGGPGGGRGGPGGGRGGPQRQQRRRKSRRRRRSSDELQPVDVPTYTPEDAPVPEGEIVLERMSTPQDLGTKLNRTVADVVRFLMQQGEMVTATQSLSDEMIELFAAEVGAEIVLVDPGEEQEVEMLELLEVDEIEDASVEDRPPVITVMGHVDHGKTKLLDQIRSANVVEGEAGGITQHIGAYQVERNGHLLTFLDTPGHEAFTAMRARGAQATDIVILVVAADDGVMPQTVEAISHAKAAEVPIVVAVNKIDRENADPNRVLQQLSEHELVPEAWGGDTIVVEMSALEGNLGIDELLDQLLVVAELEEFAGQPRPVAHKVHRARGQPRHRGVAPVATILVQTRETLKVGDPIVAGPAWGRVRAMINDQGRAGHRVAGPSTPVRGARPLATVPEAGDEFIAPHPTEKTATHRR